MLRRRPCFLVSAALCACSSPEGPGTDAGPDQASDVALSCAVVSGIDVQGNAAPGATLDVSVRDLGTGRTYVVAWVVSAGTVAPPQGRSAS